LIGLAALVFMTVSATAEARKNILLVFDEDKDFPGLSVINHSVQAVLTKGLAGDVEFYTESMNLSQFRGADYDADLAEHFRRKYTGKHIDLIVSVMKPSLTFLLRHRQTLFPGVPIVFCGVDTTDAQEAASQANLTGVLVKRTYAPTLEIALRLQPDTQAIYVVSGTSTFDRQLEAIARRDLEPFKNRLRITYLTNLSMPKLLETVSKLPEHSVILHVVLLSDAAGHAFVPHDAAAAVAASANVPVYVALDQYIDTGAVGGRVYSVVTHGSQAGELGLRILRGEPASQIPVVTQGANATIFDWRALRRFGLDETRLPPDSVIRYRTRSVWDLYKWYILGGVALFLMETALILGLLVANAQRRRAERLRKEAEEELQRQRDELAHAHRLTALGELAASFAHDLGQPLEAILANAEAARRLAVIHQVGPPDVQEALADLEDDAKRAAETTHRLRDLFRKESPVRDAVDLNAVVGDVLRLLRSDIQQKGIRVLFTRSADLPPVLGDAIQLRQVILNILVNAGDAIVRAGKAERNVRIETSVGGGRITVVIRDNGIGADEPTLDRMFDRFVTTKPHGLGMGLAISRTIVESHGGSIWATRNHDSGLTLHLELPAVVTARTEDREDALRAGSSAFPEYDVGE